MSDDALFLAWVGSMLFVVAVVIGLVLWSDRNAFRDIADSRPRQNAPDARCRVEFPTVILHSAPPFPFNVDQAHATMRMHRDCPRIDCPRKRAAVDTLVMSGHMKLRSRIRAVAR